MVYLNCSQQEQVSVSTYIVYLDSSEQGHGSVYHIYISPYLVYIIAMKVKILYYVIKLENNVTGVTGAIFYVQNEELQTNIFIYVLAFNILLDRLAYIY